jgi:hypothetical protein
VVADSYFRLPKFAAVHTIATPNCFVEADLDHMVTKIGLVELDPSFVEVVVVGRHLH